MKKWALSTWWVGCLMLLSQCGMTERRNFGYVTLTFQSKTAHESRLTTDSLSSLFVNVTGTDMGTDASYIEIQGANATLSVRSGLKRVLKVWAREVTGATDFMSNRTVTMIYGETGSFDLAPSRSASVALELDSSTSVTYTEVPMLARFYNSGGAQITNGSVYFQRVSDGYRFKAIGNFSNGIFYGVLPNNFPWPIDVLIESEVIASNVDLKTTSGSQFSIGTYSVTGRGVSLRVASFGATLPSTFDTDDADGDSITNVTALQRGLDPFIGTAISGLDSHGCESGFAETSGYCLGSTPVAGTALSFASTTTTATTVSWGVASDALTAAASLNYKLLYSTSNNLTTVSNAESNGTIAMDYTANTLSKVVTGLSGATYYFAVIVRNSAGNKTLYTPQSELLGLVARLKFDNSVTDFSGNGNNGTANGGLSFSTSIVKQGTHSAQFNGTNAYVSTDLEYNSRTALTTAGWVYVTAYVDRQPFWGQNDLQEMGIMTQNGTPGFLCFWVDGGSVGCHTSTLTQNQWAHIAVTASSGAGGSTNLFLNGTRIKTGAAFSATTTANKFNIGHGVWDAVGAGQYFTGHIDDVSFYNRVLTDTEIQTLASQ